MPLFGKSDKSKSSSSKNVPLNVTTVSETTTITSGRADQVLTKGFAGSTVADSVADKLDDDVSKMTNLYKSGKALYTTHKDVIDAAVGAMAAATGVGRTLDDWIGPINIAVTLFNGVVQLELQRRANSAKARALILQMADMLSALLQLHFVEDPTLVTETGDSVQGRIQTLMKDIEADINKTGNLINKYHQHSLPYKFFRSGNFATQFKAAADGLVSRKGDIQYACTIHTTVTVDEIRKQVRETNTMIVKLTAIIEHQSEKEKQWEQTMLQYGGRKYVLDNPDVTMKVAAVIEGRSPKDDSNGLPGSSSNPSAEKGKLDTPTGAKAATTSQPGRRSVLASGESAFSPKELLELRTPLEKILKDSLPYYENKLMAQVEVIKNQINKSTLQILHRLESGSHEKIIHPDIRAVWKDMSWKSSVKAKVFVMGLHDYYLDRFAVATANATTLTTTIQTTTLTVSITTPDESRPGTPIEPSSPNVDFEQSATITTEHFGIPATTDAQILADEEYLQYLTMPYVSAIIEAFDDDASGFVRISEVNDFCSSIPPGWTLLQWIAYWARGWMVEAAQYSVSIWDVFDGMKYQLGNTFAENSNMVFRYLYDSDWVNTFQQLTWCAAAKSVRRTDTPLDDLLKTRRLQKEERLERSLEGFGFNLDSPESLKLVVDAGRPEKDLFALLFVIIRRHLRLINLAKEKILDEREILDAQATMVHLAQAIRTRVETLESNFKHQGLDDDIEMAKVSGGVYEAIHRNDLDDYEEPVYPEEDSEAFWDELLPEDLDYSQISKSDPWYDLSAYAPAPSTPPSEPAPAPSEPALQGGDRATVRAYRSPLIMPSAAEFVAVVDEHRENLSEIRSEITTFTAQLREQLENRRLRHPVPEVLDLIGEIEDGVHADETSDNVGTRLFRNVVQLVCAFSKLPDVEDENAPKALHDHFVSNLQDALEPIRNQLALAIRLYKVFKSYIATQSPHEVVGEPEAASSEPKPTGEATITEPITPTAALLAAVDQTNVHAAIVNAVINLHVGIGITRFRAAAFLVQRQISDRRYRRTWAFVRQRRNLRKAFVPAYAVKMRFEEADAFWGITHRGSIEADANYNLLLKEVPSIDRPFWRSLARREYRATNVHINRQCDNCSNLVVGARFTCLYCHEFDLCEDCSNLRLRETHDANGKLHHVWHPLIRCARPMVGIRSRDRAQFSTMFLRLHRGQDISPDAIYEDSSDSSESDVNETDNDEGANGSEDANTEATSAPEDGEEGTKTLEPDQVPAASASQADPAVDVEVHNGDEAPITTEQAVVAQDFVQTGEASTAVTVPQETEAAEAIVDPGNKALSGSFECANCKGKKSGTRYVVLPAFDSLQYCPECTDILTTPERNLPLSRPLRQLLKGTLPLPDDDETTTVAGDEEEESEQEKVTKHLAAVDERLTTLEGKFNGIDDRMQSLETKLDQILALLSATSPAPH